MLGLFHARELDLLLRLLQVDRRQRTPPIGFGVDRHSSTWSMRTGTSTSPTGGSTSPADRGSHTDGRVPVSKQPVASIHQFKADLPGHALLRNEGRETNA